MIRDKKEFIEAILLWFNTPKVGNDEVLDRQFLADAYDNITQPHWISVGDELPKNDCYILVTSRGIVHHWRYGVLESADVLKNLYGITHWMPFPQPPKKGGKHDTEE